MKERDTSRGYNWRGQQMPECVESKPRIRILDFKCDHKPLEDFKEKGVKI